MEIKSINIPFKVFHCRFLNASASFFATIDSFGLHWLAYQVQLVNEYLIAINAETLVT